MCQLLAMNANTPTDLVFSFDGFRRRGGLTDSHSDGFGIAFFEDKGVRILQDTSPCATSPFADMVCQCPIRSTNIVAHIRKATQGQVTLANTHPFMRELWGQYWLFAHNGNLKNFQPPQGTFFRPVGRTDSEAAFCHLLEQLRQQFDQQPDEATLFAALTRICGDIRQHGLFNCILSNGETMFAHCASLLHYIIRQAPFGVARLSDDDVEIDFANETQPNDRVAVIATLPLTNNEHWQQLAIDESALFKTAKSSCANAPPRPSIPTRKAGWRWHGRRCKRRRCEQKRLLQEACLAAEGRRVSTGFSGVFVRRRAGFCVGKGADNGGGCARGEGCVLALLTIILVQDNVCAAR